MTLPVVWLSEAEAELTEAVARYESVRPELAQRFSGAVVDTLHVISRDPLHYAVVDKGCRRAGCDATLAVALKPGQGGVYLRSGSGDVQYKNVGEVIGMNDQGARVAGQRGNNHRAHRSAW